MGKILVTPEELRTTKGKLDTHATDADAKAQALQSHVASMEFTGQTAVNFKALHDRWTKSHKEMMAAQRDIATALGKHADIVESQDQAGGRAFAG